MAKEKSAFELIKEAHSRPRKYATFFEWSDKAIKELGIVEEFINSIKYLRKGLVFKGLKSTPKDPPDCIAEDGNGNLIGFEVTELVDQKVVERNIEITRANSKKNLEDRNPKIYRNWSEEEICIELERILADKDAKAFQGGPYNKLVLIIHNDELGLVVEEAKEVLEKHEFKQTLQISEAYLLLSYHPDHRPSYPLIPMKIKRKKGI